MEYLQKYESNQVTIVQIESSLAIANVEEIAYVDGIDVLFIGPWDLAASYWQLGEVTGEKMDAARRKVLAACETAGKIAGIFAYSIELAQKYRDEGFGFIAIGNEIKLLQQSIAQNLTKLNS